MRKTLDVTIDEIVEREVLIEASCACEVLIDRVRGRLALPTLQSAAELGQFAGAALEAYYDTLLRALVVAASRRAEQDADGWIRRRFHEGLDRAGAALREAVSGSAYRHTVAQKLQQKMFEGEVALREALARYGDEGIARGAPDAALAGRLAQRKAAG